MKIVIPAVLLRHKLYGELKVVDLVAGFANRACRQIASNFELPDVVNTGSAKQVQMRSGLVVEKWWMAGWDTSCLRNVYGKVLMVAAYNMIERKLLMSLHNPSSFFSLSFTESKYVNVLW